MEYLFGPFCLDARRRLFLIDGKPTEVDPLILDLIHLLLKRYPEILSRHELIESLWPNRLVSESKLSQLVRQARQLLGDDGRSPTYIKTVRGSGLCFLVAPIIKTAPTMEERSGSTPSPRQILYQRFFLISLVMLFLGFFGYQLYLARLKDPQPVIHTLAMLPLVNSTGSADNDWIAYGLMDMISQMLDESEYLSTINTTDVVSFLSNKPVADVFARQQNMKLAYESVCATLGCQVLIAARLDSAGGTPRLEFLMANGTGVHSLQTVQGKSVIGAGVELVKKIQASLVPHQPVFVDYKGFYSGNEAANLAYAQGLQALISNQPKQAIKWFRLALKKAPDFHRAKIPLATAYYRINDQLNSEKIVADLLSLQHLDPTILIRVIRIRALNLTAQGKYTDALALFESVLSGSIAANDVYWIATDLLNIGAVHLSLGNNMEAIPSLEDAHSNYSRINYKPGIGMALANMGLVFRKLRDYNQALSLLQEAERIFQLLENRHLLFQTQLLIADTWIDTGQFEQARKFLRLLIPQMQQLGNSNAARLSAINLTRIDILEGKYKEAIEQLTLLLGQAQSAEHQEAIYLVANLLTHIYLEIHQPDKARYYMQLETKYRSSNPTDLLIPAHVAYEERRFEEAVRLAEAVKAVTEENWETSHESILTAYRQAKENNKWKPLSLLTY